MEIMQNKINRRAKSLATKAASDNTFRYER